MWSSQSSYFSQRIRNSITAKQRQCYEAQTVFYSNLPRGGAGLGVTWEMKTRKHSGGQWVRVAAGEKNGGRRTGRKGAAGGDRLYQVRVRRGCPHVTQEVS